MTELRRKRGRPATAEKRRRIAQDLLEASVREELQVANGRQPRGNSSMTRFLSALQRMIAGEHQVSLRWVQQAWMECREAAIQRAAADIAQRLDMSDRLDDAEQQRQRAANAWDAARAVRKPRT